MNRIFFFIIILIIIWNLIPIETFTQDPYKEFTIETTLLANTSSDKSTGKQVHLNYLNDVLTNFKKKDIRCSDKLTDLIQKDILLPVYNKYQKEFNNNTDLDCLGLANYLCQFTDPNFYISSDKSFLPPPWQIKTFQSITYPKQTNLQCFKDHFNCCKQAKK